MTEGDDRRGPGWFERIDREIVHDGWLTVVRDRVRMPDGSTGDREVVLTDDAVAIVPVMDDGTVVLLRQYRHPVGGYLLEIPAGKLDKDGEDPVDAVRRELREEAGLDVTHVEALTTFVNSAGMTGERTTVYLGRGVHEVPRPDGFELEAEEADLEIVRMPLDAAIEAAGTGVITDAKTVIGLLLLGRTSSSA